MMCAKPQPGWALGNIHCMTVLQKKSYSNKSTLNDDFTRQSNVGSGDNQSKDWEKYNFSPVKLHCGAWRRFKTSEGGGQGSRNTPEFPKCMQSDL